MFTIVLLSAVLLPSNAGADEVELCNSVQYSVRCSDEYSEAPVLMAAAGAGAGSYDVEYCVQSPTPALKPTSWELVVKYHSELPRTSCDYTLGIRGAQWPEHSPITLPLDYNLTCTNYVCFKQQLDLMFRSCYRLENRLRSHSQSYTKNSYHYVENNIPGLEYYKNQKPLVHNIKLEFHSFSWYTGQLPLTQYSVVVCEQNPTTGENENCQSACKNCSRVSIEGRAQLRCRLAPSPRCYQLQLKHYEPWASLFSDAWNTYGVACPEAEDKSIPVSDTTAWWVGGVALLLCVGALAALLTRHSRLVKQVKQRVRDVWISRRQSELEARRVLGAGDARPQLRILLLYARDAAAERVVAALRAALERVAPGQVYDIFSPEVTALAGGAANAWVCSAVRDMRVVLLQLPALRLLHEQQLSAGDGDAPRLREPLLARAVRRTPVFGDTLLQYALRVLSDAHAAHPDPYRQYHLATLSELPEDLFPYVTPFRRYELPAAAAVLLRDLSPDAPDPSPDLPDALREEMAAAAAELVQFVRDNSNYMQDELIMLD